MWLDDDGEEPESGSYPDPSTRPWRHPSEIAAENAKAAEAAAALTASAAAPTLVTSGATSILWPISVVGGCIAVAALGVFGLYVTGSAPDRENIVSAATTIGSGSLTGPPAADILAAEREDAELESLDAESDALTAGSEAGEEHAGEVGAAPTTTTTTTAPAADPPVETSVPNSLPAQPDAQAPPALYRTTDLSDGSIASVAKVDRFLITSASAVAGYDSLSLRVSGRWVTAEVAHRDLQSDVAILVPVVPLDDLDIPSAVVGGSVNPGATVYLGYCDRSPEQGAAEVSGPGCGVGQVEEARTPEPVEQPPTRAEGAPVPPLDPDANTEDGPDRYEADRDGQGGGVTGGIDAEDFRVGTVYSMSQTLRTLGDHYIYDPIRTQIPQPNGAAGSPLRDTDGRIVGLVVGSSSPSVSAIPIDRAMAVAESFAATGQPTTNWIGLDVRAAEQGMIVTAVDPDGPAYEILNVGDVIDQVQKQRSTEPDHLAHVVRQSEVGAEVQVWVKRGEGRSRRIIVVGTRNG